MSLKQPMASKAQARLVIGHGTYGSVTSSECGDAVKQTSVFESNCLGNNFGEMVFVATSIGRPVQNVVAFSSVSLTETRGRSVFNIAMEKGIMTLRDHSFASSWDVRKRVVLGIIRDLSCALRHLHSSGVIHCDLKPDNVIITASGEARLIDFGSCRLWNRPVAPISDTRKVMCTYAYCAPEALHSGSDPSPACDAYSLGVTLYVYLYRKELFNPGDITREAASVALNNLHRSSHFPFELKQPHGISDEVTQIILRLIDPDPMTRLDIDCLASRFEVSLPISLHLVLDDGDPVPKAHEVQCAGAIADMFTACQRSGCTAAFGLAVNILVRFAAATSWPVSSDIVNACLTLAVATNNPDHFQPQTAKQQQLIIRIITALNFRIYADTCDWLLLSVYNEVSIDANLLCTCLMQCHARTRETVYLYLLVRRMMLT